MAANELQLTIARKEGAFVVTLAGQARLNVEEAVATLQQEVIAHKPKLVVVDCSKLEFLSSIGMSMVLNLRSGVTKGGGVVRLTGLIPLVEGMLRNARVLSLFETFTDVTAALAGKE
jgi:anti-anti-sigma factor